jgi:hypothetical protein
MTRACNLDSLDEVKWMDGEDDVGKIIKRVNRPGGTFTFGTGNDAVTTLCVYVLKHMEHAQQVPTAASITLEVVRGYREQQRYEDNFKKTAIEPDINDKNWPWNM